MTQPQETASSASERCSRSQLNIQKIRASRLWRVAGYEYHHIPSVIVLMETAERYSQRDLVALTWSSNGEIFGVMGPWAGDGVPSVLEEIRASGLIVTAYASAKDVGVGGSVVVGRYGVGVRVEPAAAAEEKYVAEAIIVVVAAAVSGAAGWVQFDGQPLAQVYTTRIPALFHILGPSHSCPIVVHRPREMFDRLQREIQPPNVL